MSTENLSEKVMEIDIKLPIGIVLGGGGVLGDFQVGALKFLLKFVKGKKPVIICGTSVGAINAAGIAAAIATDQDTSNLEALWLKGMMTVSQLYEYEGWFDQMLPHLKALIRGGTIARFDAILEVIHHSVDALAHSNKGIFANLETALRDLSDANLSILKRAPIRKKFSTYITDSDLQRVIASTNIKLFLAAVTLEQGELEYFCNKACTNVESTQTVRSTPESLTEAVFASASLPGIFKPTQIYSKNYVDGSIRDVVPIDIAYSCGAQTIFTVLCYPCNVPQHPTYVGSNDEISDWRGRANLLDIVQRSLNILINETIQNHLNSYGTEKNRLKPCDQRPGHFIIDPVVNVHPFMEFHPGLIKINMDYGYMRAFDVVHGSQKNIPRECDDLTKKITLKRRKIWEKEHQFIEELCKAKYFDCPNSDISDQFKWLGYRVDTTILYDIRNLKKDLKQLVCDRMKKCGDESIPRAPDDVKNAYKKWEIHNWDLKYQTLEPIVPTPWDRLDLGKKEVPVPLLERLHLGKNDLPVPLYCGKWVIKAEKPP